MKIEYLLFNLIVFLGPLILSLVPIFFEKKPNLKSALFAISIPAILFLIWDYLVIGFFWSFNEKYILGYRILNIPIEEILFFFTVPYSCLLVWENWKRTFRNESKIFLRLFLILTILTLMIFLFNLTYTFVVLLVFLLVIIADIAFKLHLFNSVQFQSFLGIVIILTLITNGYLTARPVVLYNEAVKTNILISTVPVEDVVYGLALISLVVIVYEKRLLQNKES